MEPQLKILIVEDVQSDAELAKRELKRAGIACEMVRVETKADFLGKLEELNPDLIISDFSLPEFDGKSALALARESYPDIPFIFVSGTIGEEAAIESLKNGATDYILKNNLARLPTAVRRALQDKQERAARRQVEQELRESEERFRLLWQTTSDAVVIMDGGTRIQHANPAMMKVFGYAPEEVTGREIAMLQPERLREAHRRGVKRYLETGVKTLDWRSTEVVALHRDGHEFPVEVTFSHINFGGESLFAGFMRDITGRKLQEEKIARLSRIHTVLSSINSLIVRVRDRQELFNEACRIAVEHGGFGIAWIGLFNPETLEITPAACAGVDAESLLARSRNTARPDTPMGQGVVGRAIREKRAVFSNDIAAEPGVGGERRKEAIRRGYRSSISIPLLVDGEVAGNLSLFAREPDFFTADEIKLLNELAGDISFALDHIAKEEKLNYLAYYDVLTGLPNRALFDNRMAQRLRAAGHKQSTVALVLFDLERFRAINDTLGRAAADRLLKLIAERLQGVIFDRDNLARVHAGVFAALFSDVGDETDIARIVEEKIIACLGRPFTLEGQEVRVSAKAGVALFPGDATEPDALFSNAEIALRQAKVSSEHYVFYARNMNARIAERLKLENKLQRALEREEFVLFYQPKVDLRTARVMGLEALMRWNDPDSGLVPPMEFIPVLEETGMIVEAGAWAMKQAVLQYAVWQAAGLRPLRIAVNVSQVQLKRKDFVAAVQQAIAIAGKSDHGLDLEITESMIMDDVESSIEKLKLVRGLGTGIAIDDFGTGYSSLRYLARLPVTALKIDRAFVRDVTTNPDNRAIVSTVISLAHNMKLTVIAEGVETGEQRDLLKRLKCDEMQGYLFSKPVPAEQVPALLARGEKSVVI